MRLQVFSDLHLEFGRFEPTLNHPDVVVLAGDIHQGTAGVKWAKQYLP
jgi:3',5'-cyclic AMP phosphodiesterase CpdA